MFHRLDNEPPNVNNIFNAKLYPTTQCFGNETSVIHLSTVQIDSYSKPVEHDGIFLQKCLTAFTRLTIFEKSFIIDVWLGSKYVSVLVYLRAITLNIRLKL